MKHTPLVSDKPLPEYTNAPMVTFNEWEANGHREPIEKPFEPGLIVLGSIVIIAFIVVACGTIWSELKSKKKTGLGPIKSKIVKIYTFKLDE